MLQNEDLHGEGAGRKERCAGLQLMVGNGDVAYSIWSMISVTKEENIAPKTVSTQIVPEYGG